jgi:hypothetical protein
VAETLPFGTADLGGVTMKHGYYASTSIAAVVLVTALCGPARADDGDSGYDPSPLCASAAPSASDVVAALATIRTAIAAEAEAAGGLGVSQQNPHESITHRLDRVQQMSRQDVAVDGSSASTTHQVIDGVNGDTYAGHLVGDKGDARGQLALKALGQTESWVKLAAAGSEMSTDAMVLAAIATSDVARLQDSATDSTAAHAFTCVVQQPTDDSLTGLARLVLTDRYQQSSRTELSQVYTLEFNPTGALATLRTEVTINAATTAQVRTGTFAYPGAPVTPPPVITAKQWDAALVRGSFTALQARSLAGARAKVKKVAGHAARVNAVRKLAKADAAGFFRAARSSAVRDGVTVTTARARGGTAVWSFTLTVAGAKVTVRSNLP